jgi:hypothetical protein
MTRGAAAILLALFAVTGAREASAQSWRRLQGGSYLHYELGGWSAVDDTDAAGPTELVLAGARLGGFVARNRRVAYHIGLHLFAGSTLRAPGFAYDVALFPAGAVLRLGATSILGVAVGVGASGAIGTLDDAVTLPIDALAEFGDRVRVISRARVAFLGATAARQGGAPSLPAGDEFEAMLGLRIGKHERRFRAAYGFGYFIAASYREQLGARFIGITIGYSIDVASHPGD